MVFTIKKGTGKKKMNEILKKFKRTKRFNDKRYLGKVKWDIDALEYQKKYEMNGIRILPDNILKCLVAHNQLITNN